jgi:hypothetical protein
VPVPVRWWRPQSPRAWWAWERKRWSRWSTSGSQGYLWPMLDRQHKAKSKEKRLRKSFFKY